MKVGVLLSGGVDSSYSAYLMKEAGHEVVGFYLKLHDDEEKHKENIKNVKKVAKNLNIKVEIIEAKELFKKEVYDYFVDSYKLGFTPNPCAMCNPKIKFGYAVEKILEYGCEQIASGHYARIENGYIQEALDGSKDQSYFLYGLQKDVIDKLIFPLGDKYKSDIKSQAFESMPCFGELQEYKESQEVCFVKNTYIEILENHFNVNKDGFIKDSDGQIIGKHKGYMHYTVGQRKGLDIPLAKVPHYVLNTEPKTNTVVVGKEDELQVSHISAVNFSLDEEFESGEYFVKARYRSKKIKAVVQKYSNNIQVSLLEPLFGVAIGQSLVVYKNDLVVGGGIIV
ncbi:tRNA 2-thiouridine(34) synthase MnmA [Arcobacter sp. FWKO B]|uniref:tRNA 2-thiouridine(34) synthase MnmA n=1 Tax=Arcobacter sp. FWKO B TaxID=2593672 RepID=UPI0018A698FC|nr:tRNA 2-thiouridine(34) synthase MnmA [Arcobacter sp. FWKO B]QOG11815.1 tRNA 2-thiouridine(34) synthase MnmA [Arcobacter sp. FWKO B]